MSLLYEHEYGWNVAMNNSHAAVSTRKGFNYGVWFGFIAVKKQGKQESLNHYNIIMDVFNQNTLQERPHNIHKIDFLEKQYIATMKNYSALSNLEYELP